MKNQAAGVLTLELLKAAMKKGMEDPVRETFTCKQCNQERIMHGMEMTKRIDGLNYFVCDACAFIRSDE